MTKSYLLLFKLSSCTTHFQEMFTANQGFIQALKLMSVLFKEIKFYKGKSYCKEIVIAAWNLGKIPGGVSGGKAPKIFWLFNVFKAINQPTMAIKDYIHGLISYTSS